MYMCEFLKCIEICVCVRPCEYILLLYRPPYSDYYFSYIYRIHITYICRLHITYCIIFLHAVWGVSGCCIISNSRIFVYVLTTYYILKNIVLILH